MPPASIAASLTPLILLACPVGMGIMMWMMGRGAKGRAAPPATTPQPASLELLREEQARLADHIARLESGAPNERGLAGSPS